MAGIDALSALLPSEPLGTSPTEEWPGLAVRHFRHPPGEVAEMRHRDHVLIVHLAGVLPVEESLEGRWQRTVLAPGQVSLTPAGLPVSRRWHGETEVLLILLGAAKLGEVARDLDADPARLRLTPRLGMPDVDLHGLGRLMLSQAGALERGRTLMMDTLARAVALQLLQRHSNLDGLPGLSPPRLPPRRLARVVESMRANLGQPRSVAELAAVADVSPSHLTRTFRDALGTTPYAYLTDLRLAKAQDLLAQSDRAIIEIALSCGFEQPQHFATTFRRKFGVTPSAWRNARR